MSEANMPVRKTPGTIRILDTLVCLASVGIGMFWGQIYREKGTLIAGVGGLMVAVAWCWAMRKIFHRGWHPFFVFLCAAGLGSIAGVIDGILLHAIGWNSRGGDFIPSNQLKAMDLGAIFGFFSGLANGAFWGIFYAIVSMIYKKRERRNEHV